MLFPWYGASIANIRKNGTEVDGVRFSAIPSARTGIAHLAKREGRGKMIENTMRPINADAFESVRNGEKDGNTDE